MLTRFVVASRFFIAVAALLAVACAPSSDPAPAPAAAVPAARQSGFEVAPGLPPLPTASLAAAPRSVETVRAVYEFASNHPEVLSKVACYCGCERSGHKHNENCFVGARDQQGKVTQWDYHGLT